MKTDNPLTCDHEAIHEDIVRSLQNQMPDNTDFTKLSELYKMAGDFTRIKILWALNLNELCVCDLAALLSMTKSAVSHQLRNLRLSNLVSFRREGKVVYYKLADSHVVDMLTQGFEHIRE